MSQEYPGPDEHCVIGRGLQETVEMGGKPNRDKSKKKWTSS